MPIELNLTADKANADIKRIAKGLKDIVSLADKELKIGGSTKNLENLLKVIKAVNVEVVSLRKNTRAAIQIKVNSRQVLTAIDRLKKLNSMSKNSSTVGGGDSSGLNKLNDQIRGLNLNLNRMNEAWQRSLTASRDSGTLEKLRKENSALEQRINLLTKANRLNKGGVGIESSKLKETTKSLDDLSKSFLDSSQSAAAFRAMLLSSGHSMGMFTAHTLVAATAAYSLVKALKAVVSIGATFQKSMAETSAIMGEEISNMFLLSGAIKKLSEDTKFTIVEVGEAATILAKTGMTQSQIMASLGDTLNLAAIGGMDMAKASDIAANAMFGFGLEAKDVKMVTDSLAYTAIRTNSSVLQLGSALSYVAPMAAAAGAEIKEVSAMLGIMHDSGVKGTRAGTALRRSYANLLDPADKVVTVLSDLGVETRTSAGELRSMVDIVTDLAYQGANAADLTEVFGVRAAPGMIALWRDINKEISGGTSKLKNLKSELYDIDGIANELRINMEKNLIDVWQVFGSVVSTKLEAVFGKMSKGLISAVKWSTELIKNGVKVNSTFSAIELYIKEWGVALGYSDGIIKDIGAYVLDELQGSFKSLWELTKLWGTALAELPMNLVVIGKHLGAVIGLMEQQIRLSIKESTLGLGMISSKVTQVWEESKVSAKYGIDFMVEYMTKQFSIAKSKVSGFLSEVWSVWQNAIASWYTKLGNLVKSVNLGGASKTLKATSEFLLRVGKNTADNAKSDISARLLAEGMAEKSMSAELGRLKKVRDSKLKVLKDSADAEMKLFLELKSAMQDKSDANIEIFNQAIFQALAEKEIRLAAITAEIKARELASKTRIKDEEAWQLLLRETDKWDAVRPNPESDFLITGMSGELTGQGYGQDEFSNARLPYEGSSDKVIKGYNKDLKHFIKLQKIVDGVLQGNIAQFEKLGKISPYGALLQSVNKTKAAISEVTSEYKKSRATLVEAEASAESQGYGTSKGEPIRDEIKKLDLAHKDYVETLKAEVLVSERALELAERFVTITNANGTTRTALYNPINTEGEARTAKEEFRQEGLSPEDKITEGADAKLLRSQELFDQELVQAGTNWALMEEAFKAHNERMGLIELTEWEKSMQLRGEVMGKTSTAMVAIQTFDSKNALDSTSKVLSGLQGMMDSVNDGSKADFEKNKKIRLASVLVNTSAAVMETLATGGYFAIPLAAVMTAMGAENYKKIQSTSYSGGSAPTASSASSSVPSAPQIPAASDAFFAQTASPSQATNTVTSGRLDSGTTINFNVQAVDAPSFDRLMLQREGMIVGMVQKSYTENARRGGPSQ